MRSRVARIVAALAVLATPLSACTDGDPKEEFIQAADDLCRTADAEIDAVDAPRLEEDVKEYVEDAREIAEALVARLRDLEPPEGDEDVLARLTGGVERATALLDPLADAASTGDQKKLAQLQHAIRQTTEQVTETAGSYGFEVCGSQVLDPEMRDAGRA